MKYHIHVAADPSGFDEYIVTIREGERWGEGEVLATRYEEGANAHKDRSAWFEANIPALLDAVEDCTRTAWTAAVAEAAAAKSHVPLRIEKTPGVCGGRACITGTRIPVWVIASMTGAGASAREILDAYPRLAPEALADVAVYMSNQARRNEILRDIAEQAETSDDNAAYEDTAPERPKAPVFMEETP